MTPTPITGSVNEKGMFTAKNPYKRPNTYIETGHAYIDEGNWSYYLSNMTGYHLLVEEFEKAHPQLLTYTQSNVLVTDEEHVEVVGPVVMVNAMTRNGYNVWTQVWPLDGITCTKQEMIDDAIKNDVEYRDCYITIAPTENSLCGVDCSCKTGEDCHAEPICRLFETEESGRNWTEDYTHENGNYYNICVACDKDFIGHKRRIVCKLCATIEAAPIPEAQPLKGVKTAEAERITSQQYQSLQPEQKDRYTRFSGENEVYYQLNLLKPINNKAIMESIREAANRIRPDTLPNWSPETLYNVGFTDGAEWVMSKSNAQFATYAQQLKHENDALYIRINELETRLSAFATDAGGEIAELRKHNEVLKQAINQDKTGLAKGLADVRQLLKGYHWITEGRGPYAYDDERYKGEVLNMINDIDNVALKALQESGVLATAAFHNNQAPSTHSSSEMVEVEKVVQLLNTHDATENATKQEIEDLITQIRTKK